MIKTFKDISNMFQYMKNTGMESFVSNTINFNEGFENDIQFSKVKSDENSITFMDLFRKKTYTMIKEKTYSCDRYVYVIKELGDES